MWRCVRLKRTAIGQVGVGSDRKGASCWEEGVETRLPGIEARV